MGVRGHVHSLHGLLAWMRSLKLEAVLTCTEKVNVRMLSEGIEGVSMEYRWLSEEILKLISFFIS